VFAFARNNSYHQQAEHRNLYVLAGKDQLVAKNSYDFQTGVSTIRTGAVGNLAYQLSQNNRLVLRNFFTVDGADETRILDGLNGDLAHDIRDTRLRYTTEQVYSSQLSGEHLMPKLWNSIFEWRLTYSRSTLDEPDMRETIYELNDETGKYDLLSDSQSGLRTFTDLKERVWDPAVDWTKLFQAGALSGSFKIGASYRTRYREFDYRRFRFMFRDVRTLDLSLPAEQLFSSDNINPNVFEVREDTRNTDHYEAKQLNRAFYAMVDMSLGAKWRLIGGARAESDTQNVKTFDLYKPDFPPVISRLHNTDPLPSATVIYHLRPSMNLRTSVSQTLNRPEFRELAPFEFTDVAGGYSAIGNPDLERTKVDNYDVRWEWFPSPAEVFSVGVFQKSFQNPIERVIQPTSSLRTTFVNAAGADNWGIEFDMRTGLGTIWSKLAPLSTSVNYTLVDSNIDIGEHALVVVTSLSRPLAGQSRHVFNGVLEFKSVKHGTLARLLFNYRGRRISDVGALGIPDIYESDYPRLDSLFSQPFGQNRQWGLKLSAENLLNQACEFTQGGLPVRTYTPGRRFSITLSYAFFGE
jgi:TonB-dependent receptor